MRFFRNKLKDRQYYINKFENLYNKCLAEAEIECEIAYDKRLSEDDTVRHADISAMADGLFNECATAKHIVGYYLYWYGDSALSTWKSNLSYAKAENDTDKEVTRVLTKLTKWRKV